MADSTKSSLKQQRRWAVCRTKMKAGAFSAMVDIDSDSESEPDEGFGDDASRPSKLKASMSFSSSPIGTQPEEGEDATQSSSSPGTEGTASTEGLSVDCPTPVEGSIRQSPASPDPIGISLSRSVGQKEREESSQWELSSSSGESARSTTRLCAQDTAAHSARGTCPESPGSYVARMQRALLRIERSGSNTNGSIIVNGKTNRNVNGNTNGTINTNSNVNGQGNGHDCVGTGATVGLEGSATGRIGTHAAESTEQGTKESHQRGLDEDPQDYHEMDLMIAAVSTMIGMHIPEEARYLLWVVCCAIIVLIPGRRWGLFEPSLWGGSSSPPPPPPPPPQLEVMVATEGHSDSVAPSHGTASSIHREGGGAARVESHDSQHWHHPGKASDGTAGQHVAAGGAGAGEAVKGTATAPEEQAQQYGSTKLYEEVLAGLSDVQLKFMNSAGPEERDRLLLQCLEYANGDMQQATKVCSTFCNFRLTQGWGLVLSAAELEGPLRSRVHTLTEQTDRFGRGIITFSPGRLDMRNASPEAYHKMLCYVLQEVLKKQDFQKKGIVLLVDARGVGFGLLRHFVLADYKRGLGMLSGAFPAKLKAIRILHPNRALALALSIAMPLLSPKMRARVEIVAGDRARDGSFSRNLADPSALPMELSIGGTWADSQFFWDRWIAERLGRSK